jgi:hypothetical protein
LRAVFEKGVGEKQGDYKKKHSLRNNKNPHRKTRVK